MPLISRGKPTFADELFSLYIRCRDRWTCKRCGALKEPPNPSLTCSHFWNRGHSCTRFDPENCIALCMGCHGLWESEKQGAYRDYMLKQLGEDGYAKLERLHNQTCKRKDKEEEAIAWILEQMDKENMVDEYPYLRQRLDKYSRTRKLEAWHTQINYLLGK